MTIPIQGTETAESELNRFLRGHKVLAVERHWVEQGSTSFWAFCIDYLEQSVVTSRATALITLRLLGAHGFLQAER